MDKLEKVLECLINEDKDTAQKLLHDVFIEKAREIHNSFIAEDEIEDDIDEVSADEAEEEIVDDLDSEEEGSDEESESEEEPEEMEDRVEELEDGFEDMTAKIEELTAEFEKLAAVENEEHGDEYNFDGDEEGDESEEDFDLEESEEGVDEIEESEEDLMWEDDEEDEVDALDENVLSDLENVSFKPSEDEVGKGKVVAINDKSPVVSKKASERVAGKPVKVTSTNKSGFEREAAPTTAEMKKGSNVRGKATDETAKISKEGDASAALNSKKGFGEEGKNSPIGS